MNGENTFYDLGEIDIHQPPPDPVRVNRRRAVSRELPDEPLDGVPRVRPRRYGYDWRGSLSLFAPGAGACLRGNTTAGLFYFSFTVFLGVLSWALLYSMDRIIPTLTLLGQRREAGFWALGGFFLAAAALYMANVWRSALPAQRSSAGFRPHPYVAGAASLLIPGWGQLLNGDRNRCVLFLSGLWIVLGAWILSTAWTGAVLSSYDMMLPGPLLLLSGPAVRYTLPAVLWTLAVYDAVSRSRVD